MIGLFLILLLIAIVIIAVMHDKVKFWQRQALQWRNRALWSERKLDHKEISIYDGEEQLDRN